MTVERNMNLDAAQKQKLSAWIAEGLKLSEIQKRLNTEFELNLIYMEVRFLVDDLKLVPIDPPTPKVETPTPAPAPAANDTPAGSPTMAGAGEPPLPPLSGSGMASVTVDTVARPGALVSGGVKFSDGQTAAWTLDQMGRLGIAPAQQGYKPSAADLQAFQQNLEIELSKLGF